MNDSPVADAVDVRAIAERLGTVFRPEAAAEMERIYQFRIGGTPAFHVEIAHGAFRVRRGAHDAPSVTFLFDDLDTALGILSGDLDAMGAFMEGRVRTDGNLILALQLGLLFRP